MKKVDMRRIDDIQNFLARTPNKLERSESLPRQKRVIERPMRVPPKVREGRKNSIPDLFNFEEYQKAKNYRLVMKCKVIRDPTFLRIPCVFFFHGIVLVFE